MVKNENTPQATTVFFSYSRQDQAKAIPIITAIENAGYRVWWDGMLEGGATFLETTEEALETAQAVVVLWSKSSIQSHWVRDEATSGRVRQRLVPLSLDGNVPPLGFRQIQLIDFSKWKPGKTSPAFDELTLCLARLHSEDASNFAGTTPSLVFAQSQTNRRNLILGASGLGLLGLGGILLPKILPSAAPAISPHSVAVLPFKNLSNDPALDYLATGLASELRLSLARNQTLKVAARSSSEAIARQGLGAQDIARELGVAHVIDAGITKFRDVMKVSTELIDGKTGFASSVQEFEHPIDDALSMRDQIANSVAELLTRQVSSAELTQIPGSTQNAAAFNEYLKSYDLFLSNAGRGSALQSLNHIERALQFDPNFGEALALKARIFLYLGGTADSTDDVQRYFKQARETAQKAVEVAPDAANIQSTLAQVLISANLDIRAARTPVNKSIELDNRDPVVLARAATFYSVTGQDSQARAALRRARELDPLNLTLQRIAGRNHYYTGRYQKAAEAYQSIILTNPNYRGSNKGWSYALYFMDQPELALSKCHAEKDEYDNLTCRAILNFKLKKSEEAQAALDELVSRFGNASAYQQAQIFAQWGKKEKALNTLELSYALNDPGLVEAFTDPMLAPVRHSQRFTYLLEKIGFLE